MPDLNQFYQTTVVGQPDLEFAGSVVTARVSVNQSTALVAGQGVKLESTTTKGVPSVLATTTNGDTPYGVVLRNLKDQTFPALSAVEVARDGTVVYLTSSAAIAAGAPVQLDYSALTVATWDGISSPIGEAFDGASASGELIRVWIRLPKTGTIERDVYVADVTATLAQINAGLVLVPGVSGQSIKVLSVVQKVVGTFATGTAVILQGATSSTAVLTTAEAALAGGATLLPSSANQTVGAGFGVALTAGEGLKVVNSGTAQTGGTSVEYIVTFQQF